MACSGRKLPFFTFSVPVAGSSSIGDFYKIQGGFNIQDDQFPACLRNGSRTLRHACIIFRVSGWVRVGKWS
jgi:hypothetical protein